MSTIFSAHFDGKVIVPDQPLSLPIGEKLQVRVESSSETSSQFAELTQFGADFSGSPGDLSAQHDHYLYGSPKR
jgi:hypothetical protein